MGIWRSTRCRTFDAYGNVLTYGFTTNPTWHFVEAILRYKISLSFLGLAGLSGPERECFNWPSIVENAARNDYILPIGSAICGELCLCLGCDTDQYSGESSCV